MRKHILVCDDDEGILDVITLVLESNDYKVTSLRDCDNIIDTIKELKPDLILMDLWMPGIGGEAATIKLKEDKDTKHIPVIIISASRDIENVKKVSGANDHLDKPFDIRDLEKIVEKHLG